MLKNNLLKILLAITGVLILVEIVASIITLTSGVLFVSICSLITLLFIALYGTVLYKIPHGNLLKYALLLLAITIVINASSALERGNEAAIIHTSRLLVAVLISYVAGRLKRIDQNKYLLVIAEIVLFITSLILTTINISVVTPILLFRFFYVPITLFTLMLAYVYRYQQHRESGIIDVSKK